MVSFLEPRSLSTYYVLGPMVAVGKTHFQPWRSPQPSGRDGFVLAKKYGHPSCETEAISTHKWNKIEIHGGRQLSWGPIAVNPKTLRGPLPKLALLQSIVLTIIRHREQPITDSKEDPCFGKSLQNSWASYSRLLLPKWAFSRTPPSWPFRTVWCWGPLAPSWHTLFLLSFLKN